MPKNLEKRERCEKYERKYYVAKGYSGNSAYTLYTWFRKNNYEILNSENTDFNLSNFCREAKCERRKTLDELLKNEETTKIKIAENQCAKSCFPGDYSLLNYLKDNLFDIKEMKPPNKNRKTKVKKRKVKS